MSARAAAARLAEIGLASGTESGLGTARGSAGATGGGTPRGRMGLALGWAGYALFYLIVLGAALLPAAALVWLVVALVA